MNQFLVFPGQAAKQKGGLTALRFGKGTLDRLFKLVEFSFGEAGLALGMSPRRASLRFVRSALRTAISPQVEQTAALGIVFLPGAMTGLILAGVEPLEAVRTQLALMYVILAEVVVAALTTGLGTLRQLTTSDQTLLALERSDA